MTRTAVGIGGWTFAPWRGLFFPKGLPHAQELHFASRALKTIEINGTFYRFQKPETFRGWAQETPDDFIFSVKAHRVTTNRKHLAEAGPSITRFLDSGPLELGVKLGPILWQFAPTKAFDPEDFGAFLDLLPAAMGDTRLRHAVEVRHPSFVDPAFIALLRARNIAVCVEDSPKYPLIADVTADFVYARLMRATAARKTGYTKKDIDAWAQRMATWSRGGDVDDLAHASYKKPPKARERDCFVYAINGAKERAPAAAMALQEAVSALSAPPRRPSRA